MVRRLKATLSLRMWLEAPAEHQYPVFVANVDGQPKYIMALHGAGLWGPLWGYISVDSDKNTIYGVNFSHQGETPGLGAGIRRSAISSKVRRSSSLSVF